LAKSESDVPRTWRTSARTSYGEDTVQPGSEFNANVTLRCARSRGEPLRRSQFGVKRESNGNGWVEIFRPNGGSRLIYFEAGTPAYFHSAETDGGARFMVGKESNLFKVRIGEQRFEFPDIVLSGDGLAPSSARLPPQNACSRRLRPAADRQRRAEGFLEAARPASLL
jgi:hypothetical protein